jgi:hypothetical protein
MWFLRSGCRYQLLQDQEPLPILPSDASARSSSEFLPDAPAESGELIFTTPPKLTRDHSLHTCRDISVLQFLIATPGFEKHLFLSSKKAFAKYETRRTARTAVARWVFATPSSWRMNFLRLGNIEKAHPVGIEFQRTGGQCDHSAPSEHRHKLFVRNRYPCCIGNIRAQATESELGSVPHGAIAPNVVELWRRAFCHLRRYFSQLEE